MERFPDVGEVVLCSLGSEDVSYRGHAKYLGLNAGNAHIYVLLDQCEDLDPFRRRAGWLRTEQHEYSCDLSIDRAAQTTPPVGVLGRQLFSLLKGGELAVRMYDVRVVYRTSFLDALLSD